MQGNQQDIGLIVRWEMTDLSFTVHVFKEGEETSKERGTLTEILEEAGYRHEIRGLLLG